VYDRRCFRFQGLDHIAFDYPYKWVLTLVKYHVVCESLEKLEEEGSKELLLTEEIEQYEEGPNKGEMLVVRRALSGLAALENQEQREAIFYTRCTIRGKVCSLIIDRGSCTNVASKTLVDKLRLPTMSHPSCYTIQWLNQGKCIQISSKCLVSLSIRKGYEDEIWCDVITMDAYHVLLGGTLLFDRGVTHDGKLTTYSFTKDHKKITFTPFKPSHIQKPKESS